TMILSVFITVISGHDKPQPPGCLLGFSYLYTTERRMNNPVSGSQRIGRISTKERENVGWLKRRLFYYTTPGFSSLLALHKGPRLTAD
ncbi:hypothetical protein ACPB1Z_27830, partial [Escherichia coli]